MPSITVALAGNPNAGKTTLFNRLTGARQRVGNYPGVTVEKKQGVCRHKGIQIDVGDLPGTYSLTAYSIEEIVARNYVIDEAPDVVVDIIDASNLERNLYLATQFLECGVPLVLALNKFDVLLRLRPERTLEDAYRGRCRTERCVVRAPHGLDVLPAASGSPEMAAADPTRWAAAPTRSAGS